MIMTLPVTAQAPVKEAGGTTRVKGRTWMENSAGMTTGLELIGTPSQTSATWKWGSEDHSNLSVSLTEQMKMFIMSLKFFQSDFDIVTLYAFLYLIGNECMKRDLITLVSG